MLDSPVDEQRQQGEARVVAQRAQPLLLSGWIRCVQTSYNVKELCGAVDVTSLEQNSLCLLVLCVNIVFFYCVFICSLCKYV